MDYQVSHRQVGAGIQPLTSGEGLFPLCLAETGLNKLGVRKNSQVYVGVFKAGRQAADGKAADPFWRQLFKLNVNGALYISFHEKLMEDFYPVLVPGQNHNPEIPAEIMLNVPGRGFGAAPVRGELL